MLKSILLLSGGITVCIADVLPLSYPSWLTEWQGLELIRSSPAQFKPALIREGVFPVSTDADVENGRFILPFVPPAIYPALRPDAPVNADVVFKVIMVSGSQAFCGSGVDAEASRNPRWRAMCAQEGGDNTEGR